MFRRLLVQVQPGMVHPCPWPKLWLFPSLDGGDHVVHACRKVCKWSIIFRRIGTTISEGCFCLWYIRPVRLVESQGIFGMSICELFLWFWIPLFWTESNEKLNTKAMLHRRSEWLQRARHPIVCCFANRWISKCHLSNKDTHLQAICHLEIASHFGKSPKTLPAPLAKQLFEHILAPEVDSRQVQIEIREVDFQGWPLALWNKPRCHSKNVFFLKGNHSFWTCLFSLL